ncbi:MAG: AAA family ATPase [Candidatus Sericytochromatia bacterium]
MNEEKLKLLPEGTQTFRDIINSGCLYVDKTDEILKLLETKKKYFFYK